MSSSARLDIVSRWQQQLDQAGEHGGVQAGLPLPLTCADTAHVPEEFQVELGELFVAAPATGRHTLALLLLGLLERGTATESHRTDLGLRHELVVAGHDVFREHGGSTQLGLTAANIPLGAAGDRVARLSVLVLRVDNATRARHAVASIGGLTRLLDYRADPSGSNAIAAEILDRAGILLQMPRTHVAIAGSHVAAGHAAEQYVLFGRNLPAVASGEVRDGGVVLRDRHGQALDLRGTDHLQLRIGAPTPRRSAVRTWAELLREQEMLDHQVAVGAAGSRVADEEPFSHKTARTRFAMRGDDIVRAVRDGDAAVAQGSYLAGLSQEYAGELMGDGILAGIDDVGEYLRLTRLLAKAHVPEPVSDVDEMVRTRLTEGLDGLLGFTVPADRPMPPMMTPLVMEVHESLGQFVDQRQDGGHFLFTLVPEMRLRVQTSMAAPSLPGLRARLNPNLDAGSFTVQINEVPVLQGRAVHAAYAVETANEWPAGDAEAHPTTYHPLTGERGRWRIVPQHEAGPDATPLTVAQFLCCRVEYTVRSHLHRLVGLDELTPLVDEWLADDAGLLRRVRADVGLRLRLLWLAQELLHEGVPLLRQREVLDEALRRNDHRELHRAVRYLLRDHLPGTREHALPLPRDLEADLAGMTWPDVLARGEPRIRLMDWLRRSIAERGPFLSLAVARDDVREMLVPLVRAQDPLIATFTYRELRSQ
ncbi:FHIPEP family type III secretion protein [Streptomyces sp. NPDC058755]|uniref:FHIPEP family type III secretion protein n=1 Tax=Streptomyces sp. NPDC058755 TaxID=3346624 RepID=UPI0036B927CB